MATPKKIADLALKLAKDYLATGKRDLLELTGDDPEALFEASRLITAHQPREGGAGGSIEHLAFTLVTGAYAELQGREKAR